MVGPSRPGAMSPQLLKVAERARREPKARFHSLAHLLDVVALRRSYDRLRPSAAVGVDGVDKASYGRTLEANLKDLHRRLRERRYRHQPILRVYIPKPDGRKRPLGVSALEDKVVQGALREVLEAVYEQDFLDCSYGFRPRRSAHDAIRALSQLAYTGQVKWVLEADIQSFFDSVDHRMLIEILRKRVPDGSLLRLVGKCLKAGVLDGVDLSAPEGGTPQGSILSPLLANIYLHHVLDTWFDGEVKPRMRGGAHLIRYADDFVICFERKEDAERVLAVLGKRMERFGLRLHPDKTRLVRMERPSRGQRSGKGPGTFDFLGFTAHWRRSARGHWYVAFKTASKRLRKARNAITEYCRRHRHVPVREQHRGLRRRLTGWFHYFGVNGNCRSLERLRRHTERVWHKWLNRRSQRSRLNWTRYTDMLGTYPLPPVRVYTRIWGEVS
jgi:RNA-directed DNA polymerase